MEDKRKALTDLTFAVRSGLSCTLTPDQCRELLDYIKGLTVIARSGVDEILDALQYVDEPTQVVIESFKQYMFKDVETRVCSYCGLLMPNDRVQQMIEHVKECASNPLVQEIQRLTRLLELERSNE